MNIDLTETQSLLEQTLDAFLESHVSFDRVRELEQAQTMDAALWSGLADQGFLALLLTEGEGVARPLARVAAERGVGEAAEPKARELDHPILVDEHRRRPQLAVEDAEVVQVGEAVEELAQQYQQPEQVIEYYLKNDEMKNQIKSSVLEDKAVDKLLEQAQVKDVEMSYEQALQAAQQRVWLLMPVCAQPPSARGVPSLERNIKAMAVSIAPSGEATALWVIQLLRRMNLYEDSGCLPERLREPDRIL